MPFWPGRRRTAPSPGPSRRSGASSTCRTPPCASTAPRPTEPGPVRNFGGDCPKTRCGSLADVGLGRGRQHRRRRARAALPGPPGRCSGSPAPSRRLSRRGRPRASTWAAWRRRSTSRASRTRIFSARRATTPPPRSTPPWCWRCCARRAAMYRRGRRRGPFVHELAHGGGNPTARGGGGRACTLASLLDAPGPPTCAEDTTCTGRWRRAGTRSRERTFPAAPRLVRDFPVAMGRIATPQTAARGQGRRRGARRGRARETGENV